MTNKSGAGLVYREASDSVPEEVSGLQLSLVGCLLDSMRHLDSCLHLEVVSCCKLPSSNSLVVQRN